MCFVRALSRLLSYGGTKTQGKHKTNARAKTCPLKKNIMDVELESKHANSENEAEMQV